MSENGVPDDDMPDSQQPPFWGPAYHDRDLDALLSGDAGNIPVALRPVESTLAALRAAPTHRELSAEAAARAAFRAIVQPGLGWTAPAEHGTVSADTLILPPAILPPAILQPAERLLSPADRRPPRAARHRRRRANWGGRRPAIALTSVAAMAVIVIAVAVTGGLPGSIGQVGAFGGHPTSAASSPARTGRTPGSLEGTGVGHPAPAAPMSRAAVPASVGPSTTTSPTTLCRELFEPSGRQNRTVWRAVFSQLTQLAGGRHNVLGYCFRYLSSDFARVPRSQAPFPFGGAPGGPGDRGGSGTANLGFGHRSGVRAAQ
jgi:hypothetical protein